MALLNLDGVSIAFGGPALLDSVNVQIHEGEKVCLIGRNGSGKTTMMKLIHGDLLPDSGRIIREKNLVTAVMTQEIPDAEGTIREIISDGKYQPDVILSLLELSPDLNYRHLSAGMKRRVMLGRALACDPDILMLDEPTNHLDMNSIQWLEDFLSRYTKTVIFVTHDRMFLQKTATRILELDRGQIFDWKCDYRTYLERKDALLEAEEIRNAKFDKKLSQEEAWLRQGVKARRTRNEGRVRALLEMRKERAGRRETEKNVSMKLHTAERSGKIVAETSDITFSYTDGTPVVKNLTTVIQRGDKVGIMGPNGCGKTTLIKLLLEELKPQKGTVKTGTGLKPIYFDQLKEKLNDELSVRDNLTEAGEFVEFNGKRQHVTGYLRTFLFSSERIMVKAGSLSGGEKNRLMLAKLFTKEANLLILDEPTNDLDLETIEMLEDILVEYSGTLILVSHDREFLDNVVTSTLVFEGSGTVKEYPGGYEDWLLLRKAPEPVENKTEKKQNSRKPERVHEEKKKLSFKEKKELEELPGTIDKKESRREELTALLADPELYRDRADSVAVIKEEFSRLEQEIPALYARWEELDSRKDS